MKSSYNKSFEALATDQKPVAYAHFTKIVRTAEPLYSGGAASLGASIDEMIERALLAGEEIQSVELEITKEHWQAMSVAALGNPK